MPRDSVRSDVQPREPSTVLERGTRRTRCWPLVAMLGVSVVGLWVAHEIARLAEDLSGWRAMVGTSVVASVSLAIMGLTISRLVSLTQSRLHHVFSGRYVLACGVFLMTATVAISLLIFIQLDPFNDDAASGHIAATDLADAAWMVGAMMFGVGAGTALVTAWDARQEERPWGESLGIDREDCPTPDPAPFTR